MHLVAEAITDDCLPIKVRSYEINIIRLNHLINQASVTRMNPVKIRHLSIIGTALLLFLQNVYDDTELHILNDI